MRNKGRRKREGEREGKKRSRKGLNKKGLPPITGQNIALSRWPGAGDRKRAVTSIIFGRARNLAVDTDMASNRRLLELLEYFLAVIPFLPLYPKLW